MAISATSMIGAFSGASGVSTPKTGVSTAWADRPDDVGAMSGARADFAKHMQKTPAEKMRDAILAQMGVTEDDYKAMKPEARAALDAKIKDKIKQQAEDAALKDNKTGLLADVTA